jgi:hypothetical protein
MCANTISCCMCEGVIFGNTYSHLRHSVPWHSILEFLLDVIYRQCEIYGKRRRSWKSSREHHVSSHHTCSPRRVDEHMLFTPITCVDEAHNIVLSAFYYIGMFLMNAFILDTILCT